jgi:hypothetical protein
MVKETGSINRSLFMLGKVIAMLGEDKPGGGGNGVNPKSKIINPEPSTPNPKSQ